MERPAVRYDDDAPVFGIGMNAGRAEHIPAVGPGETDTARSERIRALQDQWQPRHVPSAEPAAVMAEWVQNPANRMSPLAMRIAEDPSLMPQAEMEPRSGELPRPGGLVEKVRAEAHARRELAERNRNR